MRKQTYLIHDRADVFRQGVKNGIPIGLGYFAVAFSLGIAARNAGLNAFQGFLASLLTIASAGEYAGFQLIAESGSYLEMILITVITNARYLLMSCALTQRVAQDLPMRHRLGLGFFLTDELFGISIARIGDVNPYYTYGAAAFSVPCWAVATALGIIVGNILPLRIVSALSVALYGMFLAIIIPPARTNRIVAGVVLVCFASSYLLSRLSVFSFLSSGGKTILLTLVIASAAAVLFPLNDEPEEAEANA